MFQVKAIPYFVQAVEEKGHKLLGIVLCVAGELGGTIGK